MKVFFVTIYDAQDIRNWSGTSYYLSKTFKDAGIEVEFIGNLKSLSNRFSISWIRNLIFNKILKRKRGSYLSFYEPKNLKHIAKKVQEELKNKEGGIVFSSGSIPIAYLDSNKPIVFWTDATFAVMHNYYNEFTDLDKRTINNCHNYERNVLKRSSLAIFSSQWAANSAIRDYGTNPDKVKVIPYGANIDFKRTLNDIIENNKKKSKDTCKLLFIGQDWKRKGGENAVLVTKELNKQNIKAELSIVGCVPPISSSLLPDYIHVIGFIDKSKKEGEVLMNQLYSESHFFILPTIAECTPIVFSEANSFGLPVITTSTGGISSVIKNDFNGKMFDPEVDVDEWCSYIGNIFRNHEQYENLSLKSYNEYLTKLNWDISVKKCIDYMEGLEIDTVSNQPVNSHSTNL